MDNAAADTPSPADPAAARPRVQDPRTASGGREGGAGRRSSGHERGRPGTGGDERRRRRPPSGEGFGDVVERAFCAAATPRLPETFPVQARDDLATLRPEIVDRREGALLFCDGQHAGPHLWPDGDPVGPTPATAPETVSVQDDPETGADPNDPAAG